MLSILIVNWNTREMLRACLTSIVSKQVQIPLEIIVVDNASHDGSAEMVVAEFPQITLIRAPGNLGYAEGNNLAFAAAKGSWLLTLNPDTEVPEGVLDSAVLTLAQHQNCASLSVRFIGPEGEIQQSVRGFPSIPGIFGALLRLDRRFPTTALGDYTLPHFNYQRSQFAPQPMGTFLLFRRSALEQVADVSAPFDPQFPIFFNEVDLLYRLSEAGWKCWYEASLSIFHHHGGSTRQVKKSMIWESHLSLIRYFAKHLRGVDRLMLPLISAASRGAALVRAKGTHAGFRPEYHDLQLEHAE